MQEEVNQGRGRPAVPVRNLLFGEILRQYSGLSSRRGQYNTKRAAEDGFISRSYSYNTGTDFLNRPETTDLLRALVTESAKPLRNIERTFAPDSSGFSTSTYGRWHEEKHGKGNTGSTYVKSHVLVGVKSHIVTSAFASVEPFGDITMLPRLLAETLFAGFTVEEMVADGGYLSEEMLESMKEEGIKMWVPFRTNSKIRHDGSLWDQHLTTFLLNQKLFARHYHQRSQVETAFSMTKTKYGGNVRGKTPTSQANNVLCKVVANNLYILVKSIYALGLEPEFANIRTRQSAAAIRTRFSRRLRKTKEIHHAASTRSPLRLDHLATPPAHRRVLL